MARWESKTALPLTADGEGRLNKTTILPSRWLGKDRLDSNGLLTPPPFREEVLWLGRGGWSGFDNELTDFSIRCRYSCGTAPDLVCGPHVTGLPPLCPLLPGYRAPLPWQYSTVG